MTSFPAGWYDDGSRTQRWWDGRQWTEHVQAAGARGSGHSHLADAQSRSGWYDDGSKTLRWWDGTSWTGHVHPPPAMVESQVFGREADAEPMPFRLSNPRPLGRRLLVIGLSVAAFAVFAIAVIANFPDQVNDLFEMRCPWDPPGSGFLGIDLTHKGCTSLVGLPVPKWLVWVILTALSVFVGDLLDKIIQRLEDASARAD